MDPIEIRPYRPEDEDPWLRCRALSFLYTAYFDDVDPVRPTLREPSVELVATVDDVLVGVLGAEIESGVATIDTIAVHPDHQGRGAGRLLFQALRDRSREAGAHTIDAWTRDDPGTLAWYRAMGFTDHDHYLHVIADRERPDTRRARRWGSRWPGPSCTPTWPTRHGCARGSAGSTYAVGSPARSPRPPERGGPGTTGARAPPTGTRAPVAVQPVPCTIRSARSALGRISPDRIRSA